MKNIFFVANWVVGLGKPAALRVVMGSGLANSGSEQSLGRTVLLLTMFVCPITLNI